VKQNYEIITPYNEKIYTKPGKNGDNDMKIFTRFPKIPWAHSLYYIGVCLRLKGMVEDRNYPPAQGYAGKLKLFHFVKDCIFDRKLSIEAVCKKHQIPGF